MTLPASFSKWKALHTSLPKREACLSFDHSEREFSSSQALFTQVFKNKKLILNWTLLYINYQHPPKRYFLCDVKSILLKASTFIVKRTLLIRWTNYISSFWILVNLQREMFHHHMSNPRGTQVCKRDMIPRAFKKRYFITWVFKERYFIRLLSTRHYTSFTRHYESPQKGRTFHLINFWKETLCQESLQIKTRCHVKFIKEIPLSLPKEISHLEVLLVMIIWTLQD